MPRHRIYDPLTRYVENSDGCWIWQGPTAGSCGRYGVTYVGSRTDGTRRMVYTHRLFYESHVGPIPDGLTIDHLCRQKLCVNPAHLEAVTQYENFLRAVAVHNATTTHCKNGHVYGPKERSEGPRCKACHRESERARRAAKKRAA